MTNENLRMQMLSGIITEGEYKAKLKENAAPIFNVVTMDGKTMVGTHQYGVGFRANKKGIEMGFEDNPKEIPNGTKMVKNDAESLNESMIGGIVGVGAINQIPSRAKTDYEMAFEHFLGERYQVKPNRERDDIKDIEEGEDGKHLYGNKYVTSAGGKVEKNTTPPSRQDMEAAADMARNLGSDPDAYSSLFDKYDGYGPNMEGELKEDTTQEWADIRKKIVSTKGKDLDDIEDILPGFELDNQEGDYGFAYYDLMSPVDSEDITRIVAQLTAENGKVTVINKMDDDQIRAYLESKNKNLEENEVEDAKRKDDLIKLIATGERQLADLKQMKDKISTSSITKAEKAIEMLRDALKDTNK